MTVRRAPRGQVPGGGLGAAVAAWAMVGVFVVVVLAFGAAMEWW